MLCGSLFQVASWSRVWNLGRQFSTHLLALCAEQPRWARTRKVKQIWIYWSKWQWVAVASTGPYTNLNLAADRWPCQHPTTHFLQVGCPSCCTANSIKALKAKLRRETVFVVFPDHRPHHVAIEATVLTRSLMYFGAWPQLILYINMHCMSSHCNCHLPGHHSLLA